LRDQAEIFGSFSLPRWGEGWGEGPAVLIQYGWILILIRPVNSLVGYAKNNIKIKAESQSSRWGEGWEAKEAKIRAESPSPRWGAGWGEGPAVLIQHGGS